MTISPPVRRRSRFVGRFRPTLLGVVAPVLELHKTGRSGWLRAAVLVADDGIVSVASLSIGVVASGAYRSAVLAAAVAAPLPVPCRWRRGSTCR